MKTIIATFLLTLLLPLAAITAAPVDGAFTYQGQLELDGAPVTGLVDLQFYLWDAETLGTLVATGTQFNAVQVDQGVFTVTLDWGTAVFDGGERWLDIRVRNPHDGSNSTSFTTLTPRQPITVVPYAIHALNGAGGGGGLWSLTGDAIANTNSGFVGIGRTDQVTSAEIFGLQAPGDGFGGMYIRSDGAGGLPFYGYRTQSYAAYHYLSQNTGTWYLYNGNYMYFTRSGRLGIGIAEPGSKIAANGVIESTSGGFKFPDGSIQTTAASGGAGSTSEVLLQDGTALTTVEIYASQPSGGQPTTNSGSLMRMYNANGEKTIQLDADLLGAAFSMRNDTGTETMTLVSDYGTASGANMSLREGDGQNGVRLWANHGPSLGPAITLYDGNAQTSMILSGNYQGTGESRVSVDVVEITGGSDLSEKFDVSSGLQDVEPGAVVCIDPDAPGQLRLSGEPYDRKVAGIISGADGVKPGLLMGQQGSEADGAHPVALTGRVYCKVDASFGAIAPGDLLTTSSTPGHAMKVTDHEKAHGAILGKAMTALEQGQGTVLVLVSLH